MRLFTVGDSLSQGFMSGAGARTDLAHPTLIARAMGMNPGMHNHDQGIDYYFPEWKNGGIPANMEVIFRRLNDRYGSRIKGLNWLTTLHHLNRVLDESEDYYEREEGRAENPYYGDVPYFHNVSTWSYEIADSWLVTPELCMNEIEKRKPIDGGDGWLAVANAAFYRSSLKVLSPNLENNYSQLDWLKHHAQTEGIENLTLWLGTNNVLRTVLHMHMTQTPGHPDIQPHRMQHLERREKGWNMWHPDDFTAEYAELLERVDEIMTNHNKARNWKVFVGNVPYLTIVPMLKGIGPKVSLGKQGNYYKNYTYVPFGEKFALKRNMYLTLHKALYIDDCIQEYNRSIQGLTDAVNARHNEESSRSPYHLVDVCSAFNKMDWRRNGGEPDYQYPAYFDNLERGIDTKYYHADPEGNMQQGGLFSLDGAHPSAIGQGLIAHEFIKVMKEAGVEFTDDLDWEAIVKSDSLYQEPISMMQEMYRYSNLAQLMVGIVRYYF